jgi:hypothetical protein
VDVVSERPTDAKFERLSDESHYTPGDLWLEVEARRARYREGAKKGGG